MQKFQQATDDLSGIFPDAAVHGLFYKITDIGAMGDIATATVALSDSGIVVGASDATPAFEWIPRGESGTVGHARPLNVFNSPFVNPTGVNARGEIVGVYATEDGQPHGFLLRHGKAIDIGTLGGPTAVANAISNAGLVVGASETTDGTIDAISFHETLRNLGVASPGDQYSEAFSVNDAGVAAGRSGPSPDDARAALFLHGNAYSLGTLGGSTSAATDINDSSVVVGFSGLANGAEHAFIYDSHHPGAGMRDLGTLGGMNSIAGSINDHGVIVGQADTSATAITGLPDAFVEFPGTRMMDLNDFLPPIARMHWDLVQALSVNDRGQIAGIGLEDGVPHAFLLTPG